MNRHLSLLTAALLVWSCAKDKKKENTEAPAAAASQNAAGKSDDDYAPTVDDQLTLKQRNKAWVSPADEPASWDNDISLLQTVVATYAKDLPCAARIRFEPSTGDAYEADFRCPETSCGPEPTTECKEEPLPDENVGPFANAHGRKKICRVITETATANGQKSRSLSYVETSVWTHPDALRSKRVVKSKTYSCTIPLAKGEGGAGIDACKALQDRPVSYQRSEEEVTKQAAGKGKNEISSVPGFSYAVSGAIIEPSAKERVRLEEPSCTIASDDATNVTVTLTKSICDDKLGYQPLTVSLPNLATDKSDEQPLPSASITYKGKSFAARDKACKMKLDADLAGRSMKGLVTCAADGFTPAAGGDAANLTRVDFICKIKKAVASPAGGTPGGNPTPGPNPAPNPTPLPPAPAPKVQAACSPMFSLSIYSFNDTNPESSLAMQCKSLGNGFASSGGAAVESITQCNISASVPSDTRSAALSAAGTAYMKNYIGSYVLNSTTGGCAIDCRGNPCLVKFN